jgi:anti-sigma factor RsiW
MADERRSRQLMQRALDEDLAPEESAALRQHLEEDASAAQHYNRLNAVDSMLREAPSARAPQGMAARIMASLAEVAEMVDIRQLSRVSGLALAVGLGLVGAVMIPLLLVLVLVTLGSLLSGLGLAAAIQRVLTLLAVLSNEGQALLLQLQSTLSANPTLTLLMLSLVPLTLVWLLRFSQRRRANDPSQGA